MTDRIVVSGRGLVTPIGVGLDENMKALKEGKTGTVFVPEWKELGLDAQVAGLSNHDVECPVLNQKNKRFMSANSKMAVAAAYEALTEAGFTMENLPHEMAAPHTPKSTRTQPPTWKTAASAASPRSPSRASCHLPQWRTSRSSSGSPENPTTSARHAPAAPRRSSRARASFSPGNMTSSWSAAPKRSAGNRRSDSTPCALSRTPTTTHRTEQAVRSTRSVTDSFSAKAPAF